MMIYSVVFSPLAVSDLERIHDYILDDLESPIASESVISGILDSIERLSQFPESGTKLKVTLVDAFGYRYVISGNWMAFYRFENETIYVDRVLYAKSDYLNALFEEIDLDCP